MFFKVKRLFTMVFLLIASQLVKAQQIPFPLQVTGQNNRSRPIITAVPFLSITPDAKSAGMGETGVALQPNAASTYWNPAKLAFIESNVGISFSVTPWLRKITSDMVLNHLAFYKKISTKETIATSLVYFNLGSLTLTNTSGFITGQYNPREFAFDATYSRKLSKRFSMGSSARFIYSNLAGSLSSFSNQGASANTFAADLAMFYSNDELVVLNNSCVFTLGLNISNIGGRITYANSLQKEYIPTNFRLGSAFTLASQKEHTVTFAFDVNKLMVPSPPILDQSGNIISGSLPSNHTLGGILSSFFDAPEGLKEEAQEVIIASGIEYWYRNLFALRSGYFHENQNKGNRKYFTVGLGIKYQMFGVDFAYLVATQQNNPLEDTLRFSLLVNFDKKSTSSLDAKDDSVF